MTREQRIAALEAGREEQRILILDGAMGTMIQRYKLGRGGLSRIALQETHRTISGATTICWCSRSRRHHQRDPRRYLEAGADILETNTFNAQAISQTDYGLADIAMS